MNADANTFFSEEADTRQALGRAVARFGIPAAEAARNMARNMARVTVDVRPASKEGTRRL